MKECVMPGCTNESELGGLCSYCKRTKKTTEYRPLLGVKPEVQPQLMLPGKKKKVPHNRLPRKTITCPCGKKRENAVGGCHTYKYCSNACRNKYHAPTATHAKYTITPEMDAQIRELYENHVGKVAPTNGAPVRELAEKLGLPRWKVSRRALHLGLVSKARKEPDWSAEEITILKENARFSPEIIQRKLRSAGFSRSANGVILKMRRLGGPSMLIQGYTAGDVAKLFGIDSHSVIGWIERGILDAERRGTNRTPQQGGDQWYITADSVREFVRKWVALIDFRKIDKYWLVELLTANGNDAAGSSGAHT